MLNASEIAERVRDIMQLARLDPAMPGNFEMTTKVIYGRHMLDRTKHLDEEVYRKVIALWQNSPWRVSV